MNATATSDSVIPWGVSWIGVTGEELDPECEIWEETEDGEGQHGCYLHLGNSKIPLVGLQNTGEVLTCVGEVHSRGSNDKQNPENYGVFWVSERDGGY